MAYKIPNWRDFQQYKDRKPTWIKLHKSLLDNRSFHTLPVSARAMLPMLWLLASENKDANSGMIDLSVSDIAFRLRLSDGEAEKNLQALTSSCFIEIVHFDTENYETVRKNTHSVSVSEVDGLGKEKEVRFPKPPKTSLADLSPSHIAEWLAKKRTEGVYLHHDPAHVLEEFRNYCERMGKTYANYVAAYQNAFKWDSCQPSAKKDEVKSWVAAQR